MPMAGDIDQNVAALLAAASDHGATIGIERSRGVAAEAQVLLDWLNYLRQSEATGVADALLDGTQGAIVETMGCLALGLVRPALASLRSEIDMTLAWLYFKDHKVEWNQLRDAGRGFQTKAKVLDYVKKHWPGFQSRFKLLTQKHTRREEDPYQLLSAHIHGQTDFTAPRVGQLVELVGDAQLSEDCVILQHDVAEYIGDVLLALYGDKWTALPGSVMNGLEHRLNTKQRKAIFA